MWKIAKFDVEVQGQERSEVTLGAINQLPHSQKANSGEMQGLLNPTQANVIKYPASQGLLNLHPVIGY